MHKLFLLMMAFAAASGGEINAQTVQVPYSGTVPFSGSVAVQVQVSGLPSGCTAGTPVFLNGTITVPVNCGGPPTPPPPGTNCAAASTAVCPIGISIVVPSTSGANVRGTPAAGGGNGPLVGTQPQNAPGVIVTNPIPQATPGVGWQVVNFGDPNCTATGVNGVFTAKCGYVGNNNLVVAGTAAPPTVSCAPTSVPPSGTSNCSSNQAIASWKVSNGTIDTNGKLTAPATPQTVMATGTNPNGSGTAPVQVTASPPTTCAVTLSPSGAQDNAALLAAIARAGSGCVELLHGTFQLAAWTPPANTKLVLDDGVTIADCNIFGQFTPFFGVANPFSITGAGPAFTALVTMPINYANAKKQVAAGKDYEYQHCFALTGGVSGVVLKNINLLNCAGDGVTLVNTKGATITNLNSATNIRQGMAVTGPAANVAITGGNLHDGPLSGFDVEPDSGVTGNIQMTITGLQTTNNKGGGRSFGLMNLSPSNTVSITDTGGKSVNDGGIGFAFWNNNDLTGNATGSVTVSNFSVTNSQYDGVYGRRSTNGWTIAFKNGTITNPNQGGKDPHYGTNAALGLGLFGGENGIPGGVSWSGITIVGGNAAMDIPSNAQQVSVSSSTWNGKAISYP